MRSTAARMRRLSETVSRLWIATSPDSVSTTYAFTNAPSCFSGKRWIFGSCVHTSSPVINPERGS